MSDQFPPPYEYPQYPYGTPPPFAGRRARPWWVVPLVAGVGSLALFVVATTVLAARTSDEEGLTQATGDPVTAGCAPIQRFEIPDGAVHRPGRVDYDTAPAHSGPHNPVPLPRTPAVVRVGQAPEYAVERAVHNLEHGYVVVWYDDRVTDAELAELEDAIVGSGRRKVLAVPWHERMASPYTLAGWGSLQSCADVSARTISVFGDTETDRAPEPNAL